MPSTSRMARHGCETAFVNNGVVNTRFAPPPLQDPLGFTDGLTGSAYDEEVRDCTHRVLRERLAASRNHRDCFRAISFAVTTSLLSSHFWLVIIVLWALACLCLGVCRSYRRCPEPVALTSLRRSSAADRVACPAV